MYAIDKVRLAIDYKGDIKDAANEKGARIDIGEETKFDEYGNKIREIIPLSEAQVPQTWNIDEPVEGTIYGCDFMLIIPDEVDGIPVTSFVSSLYLGLTSNRYRTTKIWGGYNLTDMNSFSSASSHCTEINIKGPIEFVDDDSQNLSHFDKLTSITFDNATGVIPKKCFLNLSALTKLHLPKVTGININRQFRNSPYLRVSSGDLESISNIYYPYNGTEPNENSSLFNANTNDLREMTGVTHINSVIWDNTFSHSVTEFYIPPNVTTIGSVDANSLFPCLNQNKFTLYCGANISALVASSETELQDFIDSINTYVSSTQYTRVIACPANSVTDSYFTSIGLIHTTI